MSMIGIFRRLPGEDLARLLRDPSPILEYLQEEPSEDFGPFVDVDVDKAWHGIHFLLTGTAWEGDEPLDFIAKGGQPIGDEDVGYGPARGYTPEQVGRLATTLAALSDEQLRGRYNPRAMEAAEIYPNIWKREGDEGLEYLLGYFHELRDFIAAGAAAGEALIVFMS